MSIYTVNSETDISTVAAADVFVVYDASASAVKKCTATELRTYMTTANTPVNLTASTLSVTAAAHNNVVVTINRAAGTTITMPAASGTGNHYRFFVGTTLTGNGIIAALTTDIIQGVLGVATDAAGVNILSTATSDKITMNGSTTGGLKGSYVELIDVASGVWSCQGGLISTGAEATPFSAT